MVTQLLPRTSTEEVTMITHHENQPIEVIQMSEETLRRVIQETVQESLTLMGLQTGDPTEMQKDFNHLREWRTTVDAVKRKTWLTVAVTLVSGVIGLIVMGFNHLLHPGS